MGTRILIADDHGILRESLALMLSNEVDLEVIGQAKDGRDAVEMTKQLRPDIVLMDLEMPNLNGIEATRQIKRELPDTKVIAFSAYADRRSVREMLKAGASGYIPKQCDFQELLTAIKDVCAEHVYLSSKVSGLVVEGYVNQMNQEESSAYSLLTAREREVLQLISEGKSTKEVAKELFVSAKTIEWHRSQLMKKLKVQSVAELVKYAISEGLTCAYS